jgi:hypothetical protein
LIYQVAQPDRVALELEDVSTELSHAVVESLRLSGRSFGVEQDKTFEGHLQDTLINSAALVQRAQLLGLVLRRADVTVTLDQPTRAHAEALRFAMREQPLHFQAAVESLEPDHSFDVLVGGSYRLTERRAQNGPSDTTDSAIQHAGAWAPSADTTTDDRIITAHWDEPAIAIPEPTLFSDPPPVANASADTLTVHLEVGARSRSGTV